MFGKASGPKALPSEINRCWNKSENGLEFEPKAVRFEKVMMNISYVKHRPFMVIGLTRNMKIHSLGITKFNSNSAYVS